MNITRYNSKPNQTSRTNSICLSRKFVMIDKVIKQYQRKKFHPKIQNFHYMSTKSMNTKSEKSSIDSKANKSSRSTQRIFGPMPQMFKISQEKLMKQNHFNSTQITFNSGQQKQNYTKLSKLRNKNKKYKKYLKIVPKSQQRYNMEESNKNLIQLLGKQVEFNRYDNYLSPNKQKQTSLTISIDSVKLDNSLINLKRQYSQKKYAEIQIEQFLENKTKMTTNQKNKIIQFKKNSQDNRNKKRFPFIKMNAKNFLITRRQTSRRKQFPQQNPETSIQKISKFQDYQDGKYNEFNDYNLLQFSSKGWIVNQNNDSTIILL